MGEVREYALVRYRLRKPSIKQNPYDLNKARVRLMHMSKLVDFQWNLRAGGHTILGVTRISKDEYIAYKKKMRENKAKREAKHEKEGTIIIIGA